jgi:hypothetical protein
MRMGMTLMTQRLMSPPARARSLEKPGRERERERGTRSAVLNGGPPSIRVTPEFSKRASVEMQSTSNGESSKQEAMQKTCKNTDMEKNH